MSHSAMIILSALLPAAGILGLVGLVAFAASKITEHQRDARRTPADQR